MIESLVKSAKLHFHLEVFRLTIQSRQLHVVEIILRRLFVQIRSQPEHLKILLNDDSMLNFALQART
jgi:hypothetical protein